MSLHTRKTHIALLGVLGVVASALLGAPGASAVENDSILENLISNPQNSAVSLSNDSEHPFSLIRNGCEPANPESTINCNESSGSQLLFKNIGDLWGYDGKGIVFTDNAGLVDSDPQLQVAGRGDSVEFSTVFYPKRYFDNEQTDRFSYYELGIAVSAGLTIDESSIKFYVNDEEITVDANNVGYSIMNVPSSSGLSYDFDKLLITNVLIYKNNAFLYPDGFSFELKFSAQVNDNASGREFSRAFYSAKSQNGYDYLSVNSEVDLYSTIETQASVLLDGNIVIRRIDKDGNPVAGAKYTIDGVKATQDESAPNYYNYDENGTITEFVTGNDGKAVITNTPLAGNTVREISVPAGHQTEETTITKTSYSDVTTVGIGDESFIFSPMSNRWLELQPYLVTIDSGQTLVPFAGIYEAMGFSQDVSQRLTYDSGSGRYVDSGASNGLYVKETSSGYHVHTDATSSESAYDSDFVYDNNLGKYVTLINSEMPDEPTVTINGNSATIQISSYNNATLDFNESADCYIGFVNENPASLCQMGDGYFFEGDMAGSSLTGAYFEEGDTPNVYVFMSPAGYVMDSVTSSEMVLSPYLVLAHNEKTGHYFLLLGNSGGNAVNYSDNLEYASEYVFRDITDEADAEDGDNTSDEEESATADGSPEDIANPQTGDALLKTLAIIVACTAPLGFVRRELRKR